MYFSIQKLDIVLPLSGIFVSDGSCYEKVIFSPLKNSHRLLLLIQTQYISVR
jgi:hypothetical protein